MKTKKIYTALAVILCAVLLGGCFGAGELGRMRREVERQQPEARYKRVVEMTMGPMSLGLVKFVGAFVPQIAHEHEMLKEIHRIKVGVYEAEHTPEGGLRLPDPLDFVVDRHGWETMAKMRDQSEAAWVLYRADGEQINQFYVVVLDDETMVMARIEGSMNRLTEYMVSHAAAMARRQKGEDVSLMDILSFDYEWVPADSLKGIALDSRHSVRNRTLGDFWAVEPEGFLLRYNRVEGTYLGWRWTPAPFEYGLTRYGELGYGFNGGDLRYRFGLERRGDSGDWKVGAEVHDLTDSRDDWVIAQEENTLAALFLRRDLRDYYRRLGGSLYAQVRPLDHFFAETWLGRDEFSSLDNQVDWGFFGDGLGRTRFRSNPVVDEGWINTAGLKLAYDTRNAAHHPNRGWLLQATIEAGEGIRDFGRYVADMRRYQRLSRRSRLDLRLRAGAASGTLPSQYRFDLGGFSSLRGYGFKEFSGDRMLLANAEYWVDGSANLLGHWLSGLNVGLFADVGSAWTGDGGEVDFKKSAGFAFDLVDIRFYLARPFDAEDNAWRVSGRLSRTF
jgi:hypothetical protein